MFDQRLGRALAVPGGVLGVGPHAVQDPGDVVGAEEEEEEAAEVAHPLRAGGGSRLCMNQHR